VSRAARPASPLPSGSSPPPLLTQASPPVLAASKLHLPFASLAVLQSKGKLPAFPSSVALHQALLPFYTSALSLLLFLPTGDVGRVLCFSVELCPNLACHGLDRTCQVFSCCSSPPMKTRHLPWHCARQHNSMSTACLSVTDVKFLAGGLVML